MLLGRKWPRELGLLGPPLNLPVAAKGEEGSESGGGGGQQGLGAGWSVRVHLQLSRVDVRVCVVVTEVPGLPAAKAGLVVGQGWSAVRMEEFEA